MRTFKQYLRLVEETDKEFNSFVEEVITTNQINAMKAKDFLTPQYNYTGLIYRVVFHPKAEIEKYMNADQIDTKSIAKYVSAKFNHDRYVFFSKTLNGIKNFITYPNLFTIDENQIGVVFSVQPPASIDLTKYTGENIQVKDRLDQTEEVLSFEDMNIKNIDALYLYDDGWHFETDFNQREKPFDNGFETNDISPEEEDEESIEPESDEETKTTGRFQQKGE